MNGTADTTTSTGRAHPIGALVSRFEDDLKTLRDVPTWALDAEETRDLLVQVTRVEAQMTELRSRILAHGATVEVEADSGASSTANWWAHATRQTRATAHRKTKLAKALNSELHEPVRLALADGEILPDQAQVIIDAVTALPEDLVDDDLRAQAQATLIAEAARFDAKQLRILGHRILDVIAPEVGEAHEARQLAKEEREAAAAAVFKMHQDGHGKWHGKFTLPRLHGAMLKKALLAIAAPKHRAAVDGQAPEPDAPTAQKMGRAFMEYIERYPTKKIPKSGGLNATVVVLIDVDAFMGGLKAAQLDTGERISPGLARRLACEAGIIPAVLGGHSQVLDLGRKRRFHSEAQRIALIIQQGGCTVEGCDRPASQCHVHHDNAWADGGTTDLDNGRLICGYHHTRVHDPTYTQTLLPNGDIRLHRRT